MSTSLPPSRPRLREAVVIIANDIGALNRDNPTCVDDAMELIERDIRFGVLDACETYLAALTDEQLLTACVGEEQERLALLMPSDVESTLSTIYDALTGANDE